MKDQYITRNREDTEEEGEQTGAEDTPMSEATSTIEEGGKWSQSRKKEKSVGKKDLVSRKSRR